VTIATDNNSNSYMPTQIVFSPFIQHETKKGCRGLDGLNT